MLPGGTQRKWATHAQLSIGLCFAACGRLGFEAGHHANPDADGPTNPLAHCGNGRVDIGETCDDGGVGRSHDGCSSQCVQETLQPATLPLLSTPAGRDFSKLAYDETRQRTMLFGGRLAEATIVNDTWAYEQGQWRKLDVAQAPSPRMAMAMAYDNKRQRLVLFGGETSTGAILNDTWEFDGASWQLAAPPTRPNTKSRAFMTFDQTRKVMVLFGGRRTGGAPPIVTNDTWEYDGFNWHEVITANKPSAREAGAMVYDASNRRTVLFGGNDPQTPTIDTAVWTYNGTWQRTAATGSITGRLNHAMSYDAARRQVVLFGGFDTTRRNDTWLLNATSLQWRQVSAGAATEPPAMARHDMVYDPGRDATLLFSGFDGTGPLQTTWEYREQWLLRLAPTLDLESLCEDPGQHRVWGYAPQYRTLVGFDAAGALLPAIRPPTNNRLRCAFAHNSNTLFVLEEATNSTYQRRAGVWTKISVGSLPLATGYQLVFDEAHNQWVRFGGLETQSNKYSNATWVLNTTWQQLSPNHSPSPRAGYAMAYDRGRKRVVLFGGSDASQLFDDTWEFDGASWQPVTPSLAPAARAGAAMVYDPWLQTTVIMGGAAPGAEFRDIWIYEGNTWQRIGDLANLPGRIRNVAALTNPRGLLVASDQGAIAPVLVSYQSTTPPEACASTQDSDGDGLIGCADPDCWTVCNPTCAPLTSCGDGPVCGDRSCDRLTETISACPQDCPP